MFIRMLAKFKVIYDSIYLLADTSPNVLKLVFHVLIVRSTCMMVNVEDMGGPIDWLRSCKGHLATGKDCRLINQGHVGISMSIGPRWRALSISSSPTG